MAAAASSPSAALARHDNDIEEDGISLLHLLL
jgi:hypothetical protein